MLRRPTCETIRILGVDPGNTTMGIAVVDLTPADGALVLAHAYTVDSTRQYSALHHLIEHRSERHLRQHIMARAITRAVRFYEPALVAIESPFMSRLPQAFAALTELMLRLEDGVASYDVSLPITKIAPVKAKKAVGVKDIKSKDSVKQALKKQNVRIMESQWSQMDEHSIDATVVAFTVAKQVIEGVYPYEV